MTTPVCSLPRPAFEDRLAMIRRDVVPHVTRVEPVSNGVVLVLSGSPSLHATLVRLVALERECCAEIGWRVEGDAADATLRLVIDGIDARALKRLGLDL